MLEIALWLKRGLSKNGTPDVCVIVVSAMSASNVNDYGQDRDLGPLVGQGTVP